MQHLRRATQSTSSATSQEYKRSITDILTDPLLCNAGLVILYGVNSFATALADSKPPFALASAIETLLSSIAKMNIVGCMLTLV